MAAPAYVSSGTATATLLDSVAHTLPATVNADDIVLIHYSYRGENHAGFTTPTHASLTFASVQADSGGTISHQQVFWARAAGGEGGTAATCAKGGGGGLFLIQSHRFSAAVTSGNPYDGTAGALQENTAAGPTVNFEAMTLGGDDRLIVVTYFESDNDTTPGNFTTADVTFTVRNDVSSAVGADGRAKLTTGPNAAGDTSISSTTATQPAADQYSVQQLALLPVVAAAAGSLIWQPAASSLYSR